MNIHNIHNVEAWIQYKKKQYACKSKQEIALYDFRGLKCPMPLLKTKKVIQQKMQQGDLKNPKIMIVSDDAGSLQDIPHWCKINHHELLAIDRHQDVCLLLIKVRCAYGD